jgi:hypothetical protein
MSYRDIEIIGSTIRNGRVYFSSSDVNFFPADSFGDRAGDGHKGNPVEFVAGNNIYRTDIRVSSGERLSPRKSFAPFLREVGAVEGALLRVHRVADRTYRVEYLG